MCGQVDVVFFKACLVIVPTIATFKYYIVAGWILASNLGGVIVIEVLGSIMSKD